MRSLRSSPQAAGIDAARPAWDGAVPAAVAGATGGGDWAICCSGGGIRSAVYCLGHCRVSTAAVCSRPPSGSSAYPAEVTSPPPAHSWRTSCRAHVLDLRLHGKLTGELWYRLMQPTVGLLWSEAAGHLSYRETWMYMTDGGHYDNLGLVEALRRGARHIVVLDASGDQADTWFTLGGSIALARSDARVNVILDPTAMTKGGTGLKLGQVVHPFAYGTFSRAPGSPGLPDKGDIWVCKLGWWTEAPWDVLAYAQQHSTYPCDSTLEQLYDAAEFEAYHELGEAAVLAAAKGCTPPLTCPVSVGNAPGT